MAGKKKSGSKEPAKPVEAIVHDDKRTNIPTADAHGFVDPAIEEVTQVRYPRDPSLDPQLVWRGKDEQDGRDLVVDSPPIYIQEKIDPRVLVENLRKTAAADEQEPEATLFDGFDGLNEMESVEFYRHDANWSNRMILGDSLNVMASLADREGLRGQVQMIYIDPPYGIKFGSNWQVSARNRTVADGKDATVEAEQVKAFRDTWELGVHSYLSYLRDRLQVARDLLTESGSVFVQIGDENVHLVRSVLDEVFGAENFVAQINYRTRTPLSSRRLESVYDYVVWFAKDIEYHKYNNLWISKDFSSSEFRFITDDRCPDGYRTIDDGDRQEIEQGNTKGLFKRSDFASSGYTKSCTYPLELEGQTYNSKKSWRTTKDGVQRLKWANRLFVLGRRPYFKLYADDFPYMTQVNSWSDTVSGDSRTYVVQTSKKVIERCMLMSSDPGDLVLDPTIGSGTTAVVAEQWGRRWIGIDSSRVSITLARQRLMGSTFPFYILVDSIDGREMEESLGTQMSGRPDVRGAIADGFVYERAPHVTLGAIANNPDIHSGMSATEIEIAIARYADVEVLIDRPYTDNHKVRVAGPFTVESLSPHRSLAFAESGTGTEQAAEKESSGADFERSVLENLQAAGVQNGRRDERLEFDLVESHAGTHVQAIGTRDEPPDGAPARVGIAIGPQYGTVSPRFIKDATLEAKDVGDLDLLCVLGFAFDPMAVGAVGDDLVTADESFEVAGERSLGGLPVLLVRMNTDLLMGEDLKKTGAGNLFTVFGEPDIDFSKTDDGEHIVHLRGIDVYDPTTGELRSSSTDQIALWMIDTEYDDESFFVRHCYFTGGNDPYDRLKRTLKAEINAEAWETLYRTESRPFPTPVSGRIAVKVINDYGDEVMKVFDLS